MEARTPYKVLMLEKASFSIQKLQINLSRNHKLKSKVIEVKNKQDITRSKSKRRCYLSSFDFQGRSIQQENIRFRKGVPELIKKAILLFPKGGQ